MDERLDQVEGTQICLHAYSSDHTVSLNTVETSVMTENSQSKRATAVS